MALFSTFWACSLISAYSFPRDSVSLPQRGSIYPTEGVLEALFTGVRGIGILGSSLAGSWIKPRNTPGSRPRGARCAPPRYPLVTRMDRYARSCILKVVYVATG